MKSPRYIAIDRAGVAHATDRWGKGAAYCGLALYNFHKRVGLERIEYDNKWVYEPPPDAKVTCLECIAHEAR